MNPGRVQRKKKTETLVTSGHVWCQISTDMQKTCIEKGLLFGFVKFSEFWINDCLYEFFISFFQNVIFPITNHFSYICNFYSQRLLKQTNCIATFQLIHSTEFFWCTIHKERVNRMESRSLVHSQQFKPHRQYHS